MIKLANLLPNLTSTQVSRWMTRDNSTLELKSKPQKFGSDYVTFWFESARNSSNSLIALYIGASTNNSIVMGASTNAYSNVSPWWTEFNPVTNVSTRYGYTRAGSHSIQYIRLGIPNSTQVDMTFRDTAQGSFDILKITKSTGNIAYQATTSNINSTYSSGGPTDIIYEGAGSGPTVLANMYRSGISTQTGLAFRFDTTLSVSQSAYFYVNVSAANGTLPYAAAYAPGATNGLIWGGQHDIGNRMYGAISGGMGGGAVADMFEYGNSYAVSMASPTSGTTIFSAGSSTTGAGQNSAFLSKHDASALTTAPTTRILYKSASPTYGYSTAYDQTNDFVYLCGYGPSYNVSSAVSCAFVAKFVASTMTIVWQREFVSFGRETYFWNVKLDANKNLILGGEIDSLGFTVNYDTSGPTGTYRFTPSNNTNEEIVLEIRAGSFTVGSPTTTVSSRSYAVFTSPGISFGSTTNYSKEATAPTYTTEQIKI